eukprot:727267-Hanusia_phi.AAC.1
MGFEPTQGDPNGLAVRRLNRSATLSCTLRGRYTSYSTYLGWVLWWGWWGRVPTGMRQDNGEIGFSLLVVTMAYFIRSHCPFASSKAGKLDQYFFGHQIFSYAIDPVMTLSGAG